MHENIGLRKTYKAYIRKVINLVQKLCGRYLVSIILFGSAKVGGLSPLSDIDIVIVVDDTTPQSVLKKADLILFFYETKNNLWINNSNFFSLIVKTLNILTGMYKSHFICRYRDLKEMIFHKIFNTSYIMSKILAPKCLVLRNFLITAKTIYGRDVLQSIKKRVSEFENCGYISLLKSLFMNLLLSLGALVISPFFDEAYKYSVEAIKWSMYGVLTFCKYIDISIKKALSVFYNCISKKFLALFIEAKYKAQKNARFITLAPFYVILIHTALRKIKLSKC